MNEERTTPNQGGLPADELYVLTEETRTMEKTALIKQDQEYRCPGLPDGYSVPTRKRR